MRPRDDETIWLAHERRLPLTPTCSVSGIGVTWACTIDRRVCADDRNRWPLLRGQSNQLQRQQAVDSKQLYTCDHYT